ncbi:MAG: hypothetical protein ACLU9S_08890 [Oscillospiraceae bacterium]
MLDETLQRSLISQNRDFMKGDREDDPYMEEFESDQDLKRPQPPLVKAPMSCEEARVSLPRDFSSVPMKDGLVALIRTAARLGLYPGIYDFGAAVVSPLGDPGS